MGLKRRGQHRRTGLVCAILILAAPHWAQAQSPPTDDAALMRLFADDALREAALDPLASLARSDSAGGDAAELASFRALYTDVLDRRHLASAEASLAALSRIDRAHLSPERAISYDAFAWEKRDEIAFLTPDMRALTAVRPFNHFEGLHSTFPVMMSASGIMPYATAQDYDRALALDAAFPQVLDNAIARFRQGLASGVVEPRLTVQDMIAQIDALLALGVERSPFYTPIRAMPATIPAATRERLAREYAATISDAINPAYRALRDFMSREYLPAARGSVGLSGMRGGDTLYRRLIEHETTLPLTAQEIHRLGLSEVARIQAEMERVKAQMGFTGPLPAFFDHIRRDPAFHPHSARQLTLGYAAIGRAVDAQIPRLFAQTPRTPMLIAPYPAYRARYEAGASYDPGTYDPGGTRPGVFHYNTYDLPSRFLTGMTTLYLHEGKPGHHFQISLAQEDASLPDFQRYGGSNAYVEGWALYAETLGYDMGLYRDPGQHWGTLDDEMLRAMRLVVDTGIHTEGWSRDQAIAYMLANSGMGRSDATSEVERYIADPAQGLSYKIGALTIQRLRAKAMAALGPRFDIRAFHAAVLGSGALPLPVLEAKIDAWIAAQKVR